jgi:ABC-type multidrug transport system ATPase subunit
MSEATAPLVRCQDVTTRLSPYGRALSALSFEVARGEIFALAGPGGSGKSALLTLLAGLHAPSVGALTVDSVDLTRNPAGIAPFTAYLAQHTDVPEHLHVGELLFFAGRLRGLPAHTARAVSRDLLDQSGLEPVAKQPLHGISRGEERLARFCTALMGSPHLLLLDEPTSGLDFRQRQWVWDVIRQMQQGGVTIIVATHHIEEIEPLASRLAFLRDGKIVALGDITKLKERYSRGPRMDLRLVPGTTLGNVTRLKLESLGTVVEHDPGVFSLYPRPDTIGGSIVASIPVTTMAQALAKGRKGRKKKDAAAAALPVTSPPATLNEDAWLLDRTISLPGTLGRTIEEIFTIIGSQNVAEFWFAPPTLTDVYLNLTGEEPNA